MTIVNTIVPIFIVITLGWFSHRKGFMPAIFVDSANHMVYYLAIPAMIFKALSKTPIREQLNISVLLITLGAVVLVFGIALILTRLLNLHCGLGSFIQSSYHGNLGYIGFAVAFYYLGQQGFVKAGLIAGFLMILQNMLSVVILMVHSDELDKRNRKLYFLRKIVLNPVILSAIGGIMYSLSGLPLHDILSRSLDIVGSFGFPLALLLIGASLSFEIVWQQLFPICLSAILKLLLLPAVGFSLFHYFNLTPDVYLPGLILIASPTATVTYVMAKEMKGDAKFAVGIVSVNTMLSAITISLWLKLA